MKTKNNFIRSKSISKSKRKNNMLRNLILIVILSICGYLFYRSITSTNLAIISHNQFFPSPTPDPLSARNFLVMGYGGGGHQGGKLSDSMIIIRISPKENQVHLITIPRDLWVSLPINKTTTLDTKINAALAIGSDDKKYPQKSAEFRGANGGINLSKTIVEKVSGLKIDGVIVVNFSTFVSTIDFLGGLDIDIPYSFSDEFYPVEGLENEPCDKTEEDIKALTATMSGYLLEQQFPCRYEKISYQKGKRKLSGEETLKYVRSRHSGTDGGDFGRSNRQTAVIKAIQNKLLSPLILPKLPELVARITKSINTDLSVSEVITLANLYKNLGETPITPISLNTNNILKESRSRDGQYILIPNSSQANAIEIYIQSVINGSDKLSE